MDKMNKVTNASALIDAIDALQGIGFPAEKVDKLEKILASIQKKASASAGRTSTKSAENAEVGQKIVDSMEMGKVYTLSDMLAFGFLPAGSTTAKVRAVVSSFIRSDNNPDGVIVGEVVKGRVSFTRV